MKATCRFVHYEDGTVRELLMPHVQERTERSWPARLRKVGTGTFVVTAEIDRHTWNGRAFATRNGTIKGHVILYKAISSR